MSKKIESFYCKPASYEEAVEICERAVANGADKYDWPTDGMSSRKGRVYSILDVPLCGVRGYETYCACKPTSFGDAKHLTTQQVRELYPHPKYDNQEFVPEVGQYCIGTSEGGVDFNCQILAVVIDGDEKVIVFRYEEGDLEAATDSNRYSFRPLKTEAEIRREAEIKALQAASTHKKDHKANEYVMMPIDKYQAENILNQGYIKPRRLTNIVIDKIIHKETKNGGWDKYQISHALEAYILGKDQ